MRRIVLLVTPLWFLAAACTPAPTTAKGPSTPSTEKVEGAAFIGQGGKVSISPENTRIEFVGTKPTGKHDGGFHKFAGEVQLASMQPGGKHISKIAKISVEIETASLHSDEPKLTAHLKTSDFFDVDKHPKATFTSTKVELVEEKGALEQVMLTGDLTLHGVTKSITVPAKVWADKDFALSSAFDLSRKEFGMTYGEGKVDDKVSVKVTIGRPKE